MIVAKNINVVGTCCPMPLIELAEAMKELSVGQYIQITGNDPIFERGMRDYCEARGHNIISVHVEQSAITVIIRK